MPQQNIALYSGPQAMQFPKSLGTGSSSSSSKSGGGNKPSLKNKDVLDLFDIGPALPTDFDGPRSRSRHYFDEKKAVEQMEVDITMSMVSMGIATGENLSNLSPEYWSRLSGSLHQYFDKKNNLLNYHATAEQDDVNFLKSELNDAAAGTMLTKTDGNPMYVRDVINSNISKEVFDANPIVAARALGFKDDKGKPLTDEAIMGLDFSKEGIEKAIDKYSTKSQLSKEGRIALQDLLPNGHGWNDTTFVDGEYVMKNFRETIKPAGETMTSIAGSNGTIALNRDELKLIIDDWAFNSTDPQVNRWIRQESNTKANEMQNAVKNLSGTAYTNLYNKDFDILQNIVSKIGLDRYDGFISNIGGVAQEIQANTDMSSEEKTEAYGLLSDQRRVNNALLYKDDNGDILSTNAKDMMFLGEVANDLLTSYSTKADITPEVKDETVAKKSLQALTSMRYDGYFTKKTPFIVNKESALNIAINAGDIEFKDITREAEASIDYLNEHPNISNEEFFHGDYASRRLSSQTLYDLNKTSFNKFEKYIKEHPDAIKDITFTGEQSSVTYYDGTIPEAMGIVEYSKEHKTTMQTGLKTTNMFNSEIEWSEIIQKDEFKKWAESNLTDEEKSDLIDKDKYFNRLVSAKEASGTVEEQYTILNENLNTEHGGKFAVTEWNYDAAINDIRASFTYRNSYKGPGSVDVYDFGTNTVSKNKDEFFILDEIGFSVDLEMANGVALGDFVYITASVAMTEDAMKGKVFKDHEGGETTYADMYVNDDNKLSANLNTPAGVKWLESFTVDDPDDLDKSLYANALAKADETYLVQIVIRQPYNDWLRDTDYASKDKNKTDYNKKVAKKPNKIAHTLEKE